MQDFIITVETVNMVTRITNFWVMPDTLHRTQAMIFCFSGSLRVAIEDTACLLQAGDVCFLPTESHCSVQPQEHGEAILVTFLFDCPISDDLTHRLFSVDLSYWIALEQETHTPQLGNAQMMRNLVEQIIILCLRQDGIQWAARAVSPTSSQQHAWIVHQIKTYLQTNFAKRITLDILAAQHDISITQLKRIFKEQTGTTIISYLTNHRIETAKSFIRQGSMSFTQIAEAVGYDNIYYFSTQFKKQTGLTPTEYSKLEIS